ncbi:hypothetical protein [Streptomyces reniochalinae]|uniref:Uncharacterized protein n=1 Tax=Streptomyces reniochalinae TaxID=2250578 RepID=A0A367EWR9_9ACTN|nr:hypothetical protein [Streptomyces reniochalinae]RCG21827.1 hypothetical protein DQ392_08970 [Streptomyces reniochalinae]
MNLSMMLSACAGSAATTGVLMFSVWWHGTHSAGRPEVQPEDGQGATVVPLERPVGTRPVRGVNGRQAVVQGALKGAEAA